LIPSTPFNEFQRFSFVPALSASQSFGDGVYPNNHLHDGLFKRSFKFGVTEATAAVADFASRLVA
jgi:hypothetical protein